MPYFTLANPISPDRSVMRHSLLASVLDIVERNARIRERIAVFEINPVFLFSEEGELPQEQRRVVIALTGPRALPDWQGADTTPMDFFDLKGILERMLEGHAPRVGQLPTGRSTPASIPASAPGSWSDGTQVGVMGELHPLVASQYDLPETPLLAADLNLAALLQAVPALFGVVPTPSQPPILEDIALIVDETIPAAEVENLIRQTGGATLTGVRLFDVYRGEQIGAGKKSLAYSLTYQSAEPHPDG